MSNSLRPTKSQIAALCRATIDTDLSEPEFSRQVAIIAGDVGMQQALVAAFNNLGADEFTRLAGRAPASRHDKSAPWA